MRKLALVLFAFVVAIGASAQVRNIVTTSGSMEGNNTTYLTTGVLDYGWNVLEISVKCTKVSTAAGGEITLQGTYNGDDWFNLPSTTGVVIGIPNDSIPTESIADGSKNIWRIEDMMLKQARLMLDGDANDTMTVEMVYNYK